MNLPTKRDLFNHVKNHLLTQNAKALDPQSGCCLYHTSLGRRCAVGCLIENEYYTEELEGVSYRSNPSVAIAVDLSLGRTLGEDEKEMLVRLQSIHDSFDVEYWAEYLNDLEHELFGETNDLEHELFGETNANI